MSHFVRAILPCASYHLLNCWWTLSCRRHGLDRRSMGDPRPLASASSCSSRWPWTTVAGSPRRAQRHSLDSAYRCTVEGPAGPLSFVSNLPSPPPTVGPGRHLGEGAAIVGYGSARTRRAGSPRGIHRRHLRVGEKRGPCVGKTKRGKGTKIMVIADRAGLPIAVWIASASPHEVTLVEPTLDQALVAPPAKLIGDKAYDSDELDKRLRERRGIELIAPHRSNRKQPTQDGRPLRRYKRRWRVERLCGWLQNFRRLVVRYEYHADNFQGFLHLACILLLLRHL